MRFSIHCLLLAAATLPLAAFDTDKEEHTFTDTQGRTLEAEVVSLSEDKVKLRRSDGQVFEIEDSTFSAEDREYLDDLRNAAAERVAAINEAAGHELFSETPLHERPAEEVADALSLRAESRADGLRSWRIYAAFARGPEGERGGYRFFGAMPYSLALYATREDEVGHLSVVYANKGDYGSTAGFGEDHFSGGGESPPGSLAEAMQRDFDVISEKLSGVLGKPTEQRFGEGKSRRTVQRWDWKDVAFLLSLKEEEFVTLSVVPAEFADSEGETERVDDSRLKERLAESVIRRDNGDVLIGGIPMVDQGPKGYCVPATFERAMRFMGMKSDMYLLAMVGQSSAGGGTSPRLLIDEVQSQVYRKARRTRDDDMDRMSLARISRYIDDGIPMMWTMYSLSEYNDAVNKHTEERAEVEDWTEWKATVEEKNDRFDGREPMPGNYHICMIVGYNEETEEIAVSDSWGARYELRWVPLELAAWVNDGRFFMIMP